MTPMYDLIENSPGKLSPKYNFKQPNAKQLDFQFIILILKKNLI